MLSKCIRVAVITAFAFTVATPARAAIKTWSLASDFAVAPNQANPSPDGYGNPSVWSFRQSASPAHVPAEYALLANFVPELVGVAGLQSWQGTEVLDPSANLPQVNFNSLTTTVFPNGLAIPGRTIDVHPFGTRLAVVAWRSPIAGTVAVSGGVVDRDGSCGDGFDWSVDKGSATLAGAAVGNGASQQFAAGTGGSALSSVGVAVGDVLYFTVGPGARGDYQCDSTGLDITIQHALAGGETVTTLSTSAGPSVYGQPVAFTATVAGGGATPPPGAMQFQIDGADAATPVALDAHGTAVYATTALAVGTHTVTAVFQPSSGGVDGSRAVVAQRVDKAATTTAVLLTPNPSVAGQDTTVTATVSAAGPGSGVPTGMVQFTEDDGTPIGPPHALSGGQASLVTSAGTGSYTVRANFGGDSSFIASAGSVEQAVDRADTTTTVSSDANPVSPGGTVTFTVTVATTPPGGVQPAGTITLLIDGEDVSGPVPLFDDGPTAAAVALTFTAPTAPSADTIGAVYSGDVDTNPSSSATFVQTIATPVSSAPRPVVAPPKAPGPRTAGTTTAALRAMAMRLTKALKHAGFAALRGVEETLTAAGPGTLTQRVYTPTAPTSAVAAKTRQPTLIAAGRHAFAKAGAGKLALRTTSAGRRAIRHARSLKIEIVTRFGGSGATPVVVVERLTVKRHGATLARVAAPRRAWLPIRFGRHRTP